MAAKAGYMAQKSVGGFSLRRPNQDWKDGVHLLFAGEKVYSRQPIPNPTLRAEPGHLSSVAVSVIPLLDFAAMKLSSFRPKDMGHFALFDELGTITLELEQSLPEPLRHNLALVRQQVENTRPDEEENESVGSAVLMPAR